MKTQGQKQAEEQFEEIVLDIRKEAVRLGELLEYGQISVPEYKRLMWEHLAISPNCLLDKTKNK